MPRLKGRSHTINTIIGWFMLATVLLTVFLVVQVKPQISQPTPTAGKFAVVLPTYTATLSPTMTSTPVDLAAQIREAQNRAVVASAQAIEHGYTVTMQMAEATRLAATIERQITLDHLADGQTMTAGMYRATDYAQTPVRMTATAARVATVEARIVEATAYARQGERQRQEDAVSVDLLGWLAVIIIGMVGAIFALTGLIWVWRGRE